MELFMGADYWSIDRGVHWIMHHQTIPAELKDKRQGVVNRDTYRAFYKTSKQFLYQNNAQVTQ